jgi:hypothetical protein
MPKQGYAQTPLPENLTKISYILEKRSKERLAKAAAKAELSMSAFITQVLAERGIIPTPKRAA